MSTIDWPAENSQTYVLVEDGKVRVDDDHAVTGKRSETYDAVQARYLATAHRALADALDRAADHVVASRISATFVVLERAIAGNDTAHIKACAANVRAMIDNVLDDPPGPAPAPAGETPLIT